MNRQFFKLLNLAKPGFRLNKNTLSVSKFSKPAKFGTLALSSTLLAGLYHHNNKQNFIKTEADLHEVETINAADLQEGEMKEVQVGPTKDDIILLAKYQGKIYATGAKCTHFGFNLAKGVLFDNKVICPLHAAAFSITDGQADEGPVFNGIPTYEVRESNGKVFVKVPKILQHKADSPMVTRNPQDTSKYVIIGAGPAALSAAETLRQSGYGGEIVLLTNDSAATYDRTILTKNMFGVELDKISVRSKEFYDKYGITVLTNQNVKNVDTHKKIVEVEGKENVRYDKLLVATGGRPRVPPIPGVNTKNVFTVRTFDDIEKIRTAAKGKKNIVVIGGSFIGMETAANFKNEFKENVNVTVVEIAKTPFQRALGDEVGKVLQNFHEQKGVNFALGKSVKSIKDTESGKQIELTDGTTLSADIVVLGIGVQPNSESVSKSLKLAEDGSIFANQYLQTSDENVFAAGDVASTPSWYTGDRQRIEHYNEAIQQGMIAAFNMLGKQVSHDTIPFFWTRQYDKSLQYVGYGSKFDSIHIEGNPENFDFIAYYGLNNKVVASASMNRAPAAMVISHAMQIGVMPTFEEIKSGQISVNDLKQKVQQKKGASKCKRGGCCKKAANKGAAL